MVKIKKNPALLDRLWEQLIISAVCELFEEPNVVGVVMSVRSKEDVLSVWNRDSSNQRAKLAIGEKVKQILHLGPRSIIQYKHNKLSIKDGSTFRNTRLFIIEDDQGNVATTSGDKKEESATAAETTPSDVTQE
jgi:translation initiation factor 4E